MNIHLTATGKQKQYNEYFKPFIVKADIELPKMYNKGYNHFDFDEPVTFTQSNIPFVTAKMGFRGELEKETAYYKYYDTQIQVIRADGSTVSGNCYRTVEKATGKVIEETISFD